MKQDYWIKYRQKELRYLKSPYCSMLSYYECFALSLIPQNITGCEVTCLPETMLSIRKNSSDFDMCKLSESDCVWEDLWDLYQEIKDDRCPKMCNIQEYTGKIDYIDDKWISGTDTNTLLLHLRYSRPRSVTLSEEYLIYDSIGIVGSVGGTLGMFIGFSFYDVVVKMANFFR